MRLQSYRSMFRAATLLLIPTFVNSGVGVRATRANALHKPVATEIVASMVDIAVVEGIVVNGETAAAANTADIEVIRAGQQNPGGVEIGTPLNTGDIVRTKENDRLVLRFPPTSTYGEGFIYLDPSTEVEIGSLCLRSGKFLASIGWGFEICLPNRTLAVKGTEFEVSLTPQETLEVAVFNGEVKITTDRSTKPTAVARRVAENPTNEAATNPVVVESKKVVTISGDDKVQTTDISETEGRILIDSWTAKMIKLEAPLKPKESAALHYQNDQARMQAFADARFDAVWKQDPKSLDTMGKVYNDWGNGERAAAVFTAAAQRDSSLLDSPRFLTDLAEANRLSGRYDAAAAFVEAALKADEKYADAYYVMGRIDLSRSVSSDRSASVDRVRALIAKSLQNGLTPGTLNKAKAEEELKLIIDYQGTEFLKNQFKWIATDRWWRDKDEPVEYTGTVDIPELKNRGIDASGPAQLYIVGNQFKLKTSTQLLTGTIVGATSKGYTAVAVRFDDPRFKGISPTGINVSLQNTSSFGQLVLRPTVPSSDVGIYFTMQAKVPDPM